MIETKIAFDTGLKKIINHLLNKYPGYYIALTASNKLLYFLMPYLNSLQNNSLNEVLRSIDKNYRAFNDITNENLN